ncbi:MAG: DNA polymerase III subunit beta [Alphaproteobacteria bacterium]|nr:DNA polymerase III subunit beta [Alphaproteobacteria bacterium]
METDFLLSDAAVTPEASSQPNQVDAFAVSVKRDVFLKALSHIQSVIERRNTIAILSNVKIEAIGSSVQLTATDMDLTVVESVPATVSKEGAITIQAHTLYDIVRKSEDESISIASSAKQGQVNVLSGSSEFTLLTLPAREFPNIDTAGTSHHFSLPSSEFLQLLEKTSFAASTEETRYYLNGVYLHAVQGDSPTLRTVATDGHRLALAQVSLPVGAEQIPGVILPRKTVNELRKIIQDSEKEVKISISQSKIVIHVGELVIISKLIDGTYPDYNRVIPKQNDKILEVSTQQFIQTVDRVSTVSSEKTRGIKANLQQGKMLLSAAREDNHAGHEEISVSYAATPLEIGFNGRYLLDALAHVEGDTVQFTIADAGNPILIRDTSNVGVLFVIMPMRV